MLHSDYKKYFSRPLNKDGWENGPQRVALPRRVCNKRMSD